MEIQRMGIAQVWLLPFDLISIENLIHRRTLQRLGKLFEFNDAEVSESLNAERAVNLEDGVFSDGGEEHPIRQLRVEQRRITLAMDGSSAQADAAYEKLAEFLSEMSGRSRDRYLEPIVKSEESQIICRLEFPVTKLFAPAYAAFVENDIAAAAASKTAQAAVKPLSVKFRVEYHLKDASLADYRIAMSPKEFVLEPRAGFPVSDHIFFSKAPFDSNTHVSLLEKLEAELVGVPE